MSICPRVASKKIGNNKYIQNVCLALKTFKRFIRHYDSLDQIKLNTKRIYNRRDWKRNRLKDKWHIIRYPLAGCTLFLSFQYRWFWKLTKLISHMNEQFMFAKKQIEFSDLKKFVNRIWLMIQKRSCWVFLWMKVRYLLLIKF
jgi:hypothetical protein